MNHATQRMMSRLTSTERAQVVAKVQEAKALYGNSIDMAVYCVQLSSTRKADDGSTGSHVVAIVRKGTVHTVMLRGRNQPKTRAAMRVDEVVL